MTRRRLLLLLLLLLGAGAALSLAQGLRYPPLQFDPPPWPREASDPAGWRAEARGAYLRREAEEDVPVFRAFVPEPVLVLEGSRGGPVHVVLENVHPEAVLEQGEDVDETRAGLRREVVLHLPVGAVRELRWRFPERERYRFVAVGDTGGAGELEFCFQRATELGADFLVHLGDLAYRHDDFEHAARIFREAPIPVYVAVGNHDFHGGHRFRFRFFQEYFGPLNSWFELGGVLFLNLDTAGDTLPAWGGGRGRLLREFRTVRAERPEAPLVAFTHRALNDPRVRAGLRDRPHALNRRLEADWLRRTLLELDAVVLLAGHIHESHDFDDGGLRTFISGEGLGQRGDVARILVGEYGPGRAPEFRWEPLEMPENLRGRDLVPDPEGEPHEATDPGT